MDGTGPARSRGGRVHSAIIVRVRDGHLLLFNPAAQPLDDRIAIRRVANNAEVKLGEVFAVRLDDAFRIAGEPWCLHAKPLLYEFDADTDDDRLIVVGTTTHGVAIAEFRLHDDAVRRAAIVERAGDGPTAAPAVLLSAERMDVAFVERIGEPGSRVVMMRY